MAAICTLMASGRVKKFASLKEARAFAEKFCGNRVATQPFSDEHTYLYGSGDGSTSVVVTEEIDWERDPTATVK